MDMINTGTYKVIELSSAPIHSVINGESFDYYSLEISQGQGDVIVFRGDALKMMAILSSIACAKWEQPKA